MLTFLKVHSPTDIADLLKKFDPKTDTWIISDLKSKQEVQKHSIQLQGYFIDDAVLRISDFWRLWMRRLCPTINLVTSDFIEVLVKNFVDEKGDTFQLLPSESSTLVKALQEFAPILLHPQSDELLQEWLSEQNEEKDWVRWYQLARFCVDYLVIEKKIIDSKWAAAYLQTLDLNFLSWQRKIYLDLGSELSSIEMGLIKHISQKQDVVIIVPNPSWAVNFPYLLKTYTENLGYGKTEDHSSLASVKELQSNQFIKLSTELAEIKWTTAQVRQWLDKKVPFSDIAVIAADVEKYWPVLNIYLNAEGIPCQKNSVAKLNSLGIVQTLLAKLNSYTKDVSWESLEASLYSQENSVNLKYEQFKALFYQIYDEDDLGRDVKIKDLFYKKMDLTQFFHQEDFLSFVVKIWISIPNSSQHDQIFETIFKDLIAQSVNVNMKVSRWYELLKKRLSHKEVQSSEAADQGIAILPLMSAGMCSAKHRIYLGLTDDSFHRPKTKLMNLSDANTLKNQFDLAIETNEENFLDFNLRWQSVAAVSTYHYLSPHLSFSSDPLNPCLFFIENNATAEVVNPPITRLDELQLKTAYDMQMDLGSDYNLRHKQDLLGFETKIDAQYFNSLSVSSLENYAQCSFKLMAEKGFRLRDYPLVGIDLDPRQKGTLAHELFESVVKQCKDRKYDEKLIEQVLEEARAKNKIYLDSEELWSIQKKKYLVLAKKFYDFEVSRLVNIDIETEKKVEIFYNLKENKFEAQVGDDSIKLSFRIDRVDKHKTAKYFVIYDYKSSSFQVNNYSKWLSELQFQMLFYMLSFCLVEGESLESIKGALYYQYKSFNLNNGLIDKQIGKEIFGLSGRSGALIEQDEKEELMAKFEAQTKDLLNFIGQGVVSNAPADTDYCNDCEWSKICRAPHLM